MYLFSQSNFLHVAQYNSEYSSKALSVESGIKNEILIET